MRAVLTASAVALTITLGLAAAQPAAAQINPFAGQLANRLSNDDFRAMGDAVTRLLKRDPLPVGASENWRNPRSRSHGSVKVVRDFKHDSFACHAVDYSAIPGSGGGRSATHATLNWCKTPEGWKIVS
jgi:surface antigen